VAVNVTPVPEHSVVAEDATETLAVWFGLTVKEIPVEVDEVLERQVGNVPPAVNTTDTVCPLLGT
jgi:hypothetical protein